MTQRIPAQAIHITENGLYLVFEVTNEKDVRLLHISGLPYSESNIASPHLKEKFRLVEVHVTGENQADHHGQKHTGTMPGKRLRYVKHHDYQTPMGRKLEIVMSDPETNLEVTSHFAFMADIPVFRSWTSLLNRGEHSLGIEYVSSFALTGLGKEGLIPWERKMRLHIPHNTWCGEAQWRCDMINDLGLSRVGSFSVKRIPFTNTGTWSSSQWAPMGCIEDEETGISLFWQIEHNGSWHWEVGDQYRHLYIQLSGPTENEHHWWKQLKPGDSFVTVPVAVGSTHGGITAAVEQLTRYRRITRRPHEDNVQLPIIFNDFMNCLGGDPTTNKLIPLIEVAAEIGCEYFCIDCGWYADGHWWDGVGEWMPSDIRFPNGIGEPLDYIRTKGMVPGLWLELEVMGINCPLAKQLPDDWFFCRHGKRVIDNGRYQLDYRNRDVRIHATRVIDRLVTEYGVGYIKMDYNINAGIGTENHSDSFGDGLLEHNRAYLAWLRETMNRYPQLIIENCASGGQRMDYAMLSLHPIQSVSDQDNYLKNAAIAAAAPSLVTPEQAAIWSYPQREGGLEEVIFNMINAMLLRIHQSGHLAELSPDRLGLVRQALEAYKTIRKDLPTAFPQWPLGMPTLDSPWISLALKCPHRTYVAVWRLNSETDTIPLQLSGVSGESVQCIYPKNHDCEWRWNNVNGVLTVQLRHRNMARLFAIEHSK